MDVLPYQFRACQLGGIWYQNDKYLIPKMFYRGFILFVIFQFTLSEVIYLFTLHGSVKEIAEGLFLTLTYISLCFKILNFLARREEMVNLLNDFRSSLCQTKNIEEKEILNKHLNLASNVFLFFMCMSQSTGLTMLSAVPIFALKNNELHLPIDTYQPYSINNTAGFCVAYLFQILPIIYGILLNVSMDTMVCGFLIMITGQLEINSYRLIHSTTLLNNCIKHQTLINAMILKIQHFFIHVIIILFIFSFIILCTSIFQISQQKVASFEFIFFSMYIMCMLFQVFLYCWFGNELELKSKAVAEVLYFSQWLDFSEQDRKKIWFTMLTAQQNSTISFHGQCDLSLNTFLWIIKTSYASFNLLQHASF